MSLYTSAWRLLVIVLVMRLSPVVVAEEEESQGGEVWLNELNYRVLSSESDLEAQWEVVYRPAQLSEEEESLGVAYIAVEWYTETETLSGLNSRLAVRPTSARGWRGNWVGISPVVRNMAAPFNGLGGMGLSTGTLAGAGKIFCWGPGARVGLRIGSIETPRVCQSVVTTGDISNTLVGAATNHALVDKVTPGVEGGVKVDDFEWVKYRTSSGSAVSSIGAVNNCTLEATCLPNIVQHVALFESAAIGGTAWLSVVFHVLLFTSALLISFAV